jgi:hypothetical protein
MKKNLEQPLSPKNYVLIAVCGLLISIGCVAGYISFIDQLNKNNVAHQIFYLILILFGISTSAFIFGAMKSFASITGTRYNTKFNFTGPIVGILLTVVGGFYLPEKFNSELSLTVRTYNYKNEPLKDAIVKVYLDNMILNQPVNSDGQIIFFIPENKSDNLKVEVNANGYQPEFKTVNIKSSTTLDILLQKPKTFVISGKVTNADEAPVPNVEINIDNSDFYTKSATNGYFLLNFHDFNIGDEISIITSHPKYKDKIIPLKIEKIEQELNIVLSPIP